MTEYPNPINNPTLEGYDVLATSPEVKGRYTTARALVVRYTDHPEEGAHILWQERERWQEQERVSDGWRYQPGSNVSNCEAVIMALMGIK